MAEVGKSLGVALPEEMARVRDEVIPAYIEAGPPGRLALMFLRKSLDAATKALSEGNVIEMLRCYEELKGAE